MISRSPPHRVSCFNSFLDNCVLRLTCAIVAPYPVSWGGLISPATGILGKQSATIRAAVRMEMSGLCE
jgi:hypothetical protein